MSKPKLLILVVLLVAGSALGRTQLMTDEDAAPATGTTNVWSHAYGSGGLSGAVVPVTGGTGYYLSASQPTVTKGKDTVFALLNTAGAVTWAKEIDPATAVYDSLSVEPIAAGYRLTGTVQNPKVTNQNMAVWTQYDKTWKRIYGWGFSVNGALVAGAFRDTSDGGMLLSGSLIMNAATKLQCNDTLLLKTDSKGNVVWKNILQYSCADLAGPMLEVSDGYLIAGVLADPVTKIKSIFLMKHAKTGAGILWTKMYSIPITTLDFFGAVSNLKLLSNGNLLLMGTLQWLNPMMGGGSVFMMEVNSGGGLLWANNYKTSSTTLTAQNIIEDTTAKTLLVSGSELNTTKGKAAIDMFVIKTASGAIVKQQKLSSATQYDMGIVLKAASGNLYFSGLHANSMTDPKMNTIFGKLDATTLAPTWSNLFVGGTGAAFETSTGFLLTGVTTSYGFNAAKGNVVGMLLNSSGNYPSCHISSIAMSKSLPMITSVPLVITITPPSLKSVTAGTLTGVTMAVSNTTIASVNICPPATVPAEVEALDDGWSTAPECETETPEDLK